MTTDELSDQFLEFSSLTLKNASEAFRLATDSIVNARRCGFILSQYKDRFPDQYDAFIEEKKLSSEMAEWWIKLTHKSLEEIGSSRASLIRGYESVMLLPAPDVADSPTIKPSYVVQICKYAGSLERELIGKEGVKQLDQTSKQQLIQSLQKVINALQEE